MVYRNCAIAHISTVFGKNDKKKSHLRIASTKGTNQSRNKLLRKVIKRIVSTKTLKNIFDVRENFLRPDHQRL
jgi:hypothetical protein